MTAAVDQPAKRGFTLDRWTLLTLAALAMAALFVTGILMRVLQESGGTNSYALLAEAFLHGRFDVDRCFDGDCAMVAGRGYVIFPPVPALVAMPFVALFGPHFAGFMIIGLLFFAATLALWWRLFSAMGARGDTRLWLMLALAFGSPVYFITLRADGIWFFAQVVGLFLLTLALHETLNKRLVAAGIAIGLAFLCRQMAILVVPFLFVLALDKDEGLFSLNRASWWRKFIAFAMPVAIALIAYFVYNGVRFGNPLETGYSYIVPDGHSYLGQRIAEALFSPRYVLFNLFYLFVQGFHAEFTGPLMTRLAGLDSNGTSLLAASPFVLFAFFLPWRRDVVIAGLTALVIGGATLFYHSNGYSQYNVQRYTLDWLPLLFLFLPLTLTSERLPVFRLLVTYALLLNVATMGVLAVTSGGA
ncbi:MULTISPECIES: glycosyltransferase family 39 protein [unclassified Chelatococcus]|uniref:ArnT family glycosyltransferase n=1 Tax=unclassified Chelatococcus TaxID=2638111 RepID=UPI001BCB877A|nr:MULTISPECIES: glycosyltransferase family 39 protein [unclassified Chelatococcus]CAH1669776.1 conserved membrane hypothetical protein [Hyphomicrobiales bacterium]MBS7739290.1 glycosyltransferase family 39 protein [Chelatococcus sp. HY11]MBX3546569.1 glycosyltransferase family 39 protein [Chelatococcus sp.]MCO5076177.1 glycosyltransferase family 39 protein [Chelatococcus sp.]CAH1678778.1 conserved membrane hypothetical protein [Hyphomicrobiales bacterium]